MKVNNIRFLLCFLLTGAAINIGNAFLQSGADYEPYLKASEENS